MTSLVFRRVMGRLPGRGARGEVIAALAALAVVNVLASPGALAQSAQPPGQPPGVEAPAETKRAKPAARVTPAATPATSPSAAPAMPAAPQTNPAQAAQPATTPAAPATAGEAGTAAPVVPAQSGEATAPSATPPVAPLVAPPPAQQALVPPPLPPKPDDPRAARVYTVFDTHCARCHQTGKLEKPVPAGGLANILALPELARDGARVMPGVPDASPLYQVLALGHAPLDVFPEGQGPSADEVTAVREWLREMPSRSQQCAGREPIKAATVDGWMEEELRAEREGARDLRFISLVNLYNACVSSEELAAARQGMAKLMNSLSWSAAPHALRSVDPAGTLLSFRLDDFGWVAGHWQTLQAAYPKALTVPLSEKTRALAGAPNVVVRGDWLANATADPKLYYQLLGIPQKLSELAKMNGVEIDNNVRLNRVRRAIIRSSDVTRGNRLAERHPGARGGFWLIYDFAASVGDQDLFERPLGPKVSALTRTPFKPDSQRVLFLLPNGFPAYALYDASGARLDRVLPGVDKPIYAGAAEAPETAGTGCFSCHASGVRAVRDDYRGKVASIDPGAPGKEAREAALALAASDGEMLLLSNADNDRYRNALVAAGIDPSLTLGGEEIVTGLSRRYEQGTDFEGAATELELDPATFEAALSKATGTTATIARRLQQSRRPRSEIDELFAYLKGAAKPADAAKAPQAQAPVAGGAIALDMWTDKPRPALGDLISVNIESNTDCYLTVTNVDAAGKATVIFPNDFEPDNLVSAGKTFRVPGAEAPYQLRRKEQGRELIVAQCSTSSAPPTGVEHEFSRQRFTILGNWENFVEDALLTEADLRKNPEKAERARAARASAMRANIGTRGTSNPDRPDTAPGRKISDGRAVLVIE